MKRLLWLGIHCWCLVLLVAAESRSQTPKIYYNRNYDFCVQRPPNWKLDESITRNGVIFAPPDKTRASISVGAHIDQPSEKGTEAQTLGENIQSGIESLRRYGAAEDLTITKEEDIVLGGVPAKIVSLRYRDGKSKEERFSKELIMLDEYHIVYFVELKCLVQDSSKLEQVFKLLVDSFRIRCKEGM